MAASASDIRHRQRALRVLARRSASRPDVREEFRFLDERIGEPSRHSRRRWKPSVLAELGRIVPDDVLFALARAICMLKPHPREAVSLVRNFRDGTENGKRFQD